MDWKLILILGFAAGMACLALWHLFDWPDWLRPGRWTGRRVRRRPPGPARSPSDAPPGVVLGPPRSVKAAELGLPPGATMLRRGPPLVIPSRADPLWVEKGWRRNGAGYTGYFRAGGRRWAGLLREPFPGGWEAFIWQPPLEELNRRTSHAPCFQLSAGDGCYKVHFYDLPRSLDHAIISIEAVLAEAVGR
jgi:hypothetical protein